MTDVVEALTDSGDVKQYVKRIRLRDPELNSNWGTICTPVGMTAADGKRRKVLQHGLAATKKLEAFKQMS